MWALIASELRVHLIIFPPTANNRMQVPHKSSTHTPRLVYHLKESQFLLLFLLSETNVWLKWLSLPHRRSEAIYFLPNIRCLSLSVVDVVDIRIAFWEKSECKSRITAHRLWLCKTVFVLKGQFKHKWKFCHYLFTLMTFPICMIFFLQWNIKDL